MSRRLTVDRAAAAPHLSLRLPADLALALDAAGEQLQREHRGLTVSRSDVVRLLLAEALRARGCLDRELLAAEAAPPAVLRAPLAPQPVVPSARRARSEGAAAPSQAEARARVAAAREAGIAVVAVAARAGVGRSSLFRWLAGQQVLAPHRLASVVRALGEFGA